MDAKSSVAAMGYPHGEQQISFSPNEGGTQGRAWRYLYPGKVVWVLFRDMALGAEGSPFLSQGGPGVASRPGKPDVMHVRHRYAASCTLVREVEFDLTPDHPSEDQLSEVIERALDHFPDSRFEITDHTGAVWKGRCSRREGTSWDWN